MTREQQIEELTKLIQTKEISHCDDDMHCEDCYCGCKGMAEMIYKAGYRKVPKGSFICSGSETNLDVEVCNNCGMQQADELFERDKEIERLEAENKRLSAKLGQILLSIDTVKEMNAICNIDEQRKQAVKEFAEHLKKYAIKTNSPAWGLIEFVEVSDIDRLLDYYMSMRDER